MQRTRVKICGLTNPTEALVAAELGADAIGVVFYSKSKRAVSVQQAAKIRAVVPAFVSMVGLFVNPTIEEVRTVLSQVHLDCLQFHGEESAEFCRSFGVPYLKALRVTPDLDVNSEISKYSDSCAILLDSFDKNFAGGTGQVFDWQVAQKCISTTKAKIVLAGGLSSVNVASAIIQVRPYAVDVSTGVESSPGCKSSEMMTNFFNEVYSV